MLERIRRNYASVTATLALLVAIGGGVALAGGGTPDNRLRDRVVVSEFSEGGSDFQRLVTAKCPGKKKPIGGGAASTFPSMIDISESSPATNGWQAQAHENEPTDQNWQLVAYAICARVN